MGFNSAFKGLKVNIQHMPNSGQTAIVWNELVCATQAPEPVQNKIILGFEPFQARCT